MPGLSMTAPTLLLTRPRDSAERFAAAVAARVGGVRTVIAPLLRIVPTGEVPDLAGAVGVIFTSAQGVEFAPPGEGRTAHCVGQATAEAAAAAGWAVDIVAPEAEALIAAVRERGGPGPLVHLSGRHRRGEIAERLTQAGLPTVVVALYDQELVPLSAEARALLRGETPVVVPLFSPRTARQFVGQAGHPAAALFVAISPAVARELAAPEGARVVVAAAPDGHAMVTAVEKLMRDGGLP